MDYSGDDSGTRLLCQNRHFRNEEATVCCEQLAGSGKARDAQRTGLEITLRELDRARISVGIARNLAKKPVAAACICDSDGWP